MGGRGSSSSKNKSGAIGAAKTGGGAGWSEQMLNGAGGRDAAIARAQYIAVKSEDDKYNYSVSVSDWEKNGKSRTYIKINEIRKWDGKYHGSRDYGYFDNVTKTYVPSRGSDLGRGYDYGGSKLD